MNTFYYVNFTGYDMGIISGAKSQMQQSLGLSCSNLEWVVSLLPVGGFIASLTGGNESMHININNFLLKSHNFWASITL